MKRRQLPSVDRLRALFFYDPKTGYLWWRERAASDFKSAQSRKAWNTKYSFHRAGYDDNKGHRMVRIGPLSYFEHLVIWAIVTGEHVPPDLDVDHEDGNGHNNKFGNMVPKPHVANCRNLKLNSRNSTGVNGVYFDSVNNKWVAVIGARENKRHLGRFVDFDAAVAARRSAEAEHGYHPNHGRAA